MIILRSKFFSDFADFPKEVKDFLQFVPKLDQLNKKYKPIFEKEVKFLDTIVDFHLNDVSEDNVKFLEEHNLYVVGTIYSDLYEESTVWSAVGPDVIIYDAEARKLAAASPWNGSTTFSYLKCPLAEYFATKVEGKHEDARAWGIDSFDDYFIEICKLLKINPAKLNINCKVEHVPPQKSKDLYKKWLAQKRDRDAEKGIYNGAGLGARMAGYGTLGTLPGSIIGGITHRIIKPKKVDIGVSRVIGGIAGATVGAGYGALRHLKRKLEYEKEKEKEKE